MALECPDLAEGYLDPVNIATAKENMLEMLGIMAVLATKKLLDLGLCYPPTLLWMQFMTSAQVEFTHPFICNQFFNKVSMACN